MGICSSQTYSGKNKVRTTGANLSLDTPSDLGETNSKSTKFSFEVYKKPKFHEKRRKPSWKPTFHKILVQSVPRLKPIEQSTIMTKRMLTTKSPFLGHRKPDSKKSSGSTCSRFFILA